MCNLLFNFFLYDSNFNFRYMIRASNLSVIHSLKSSTILTQKNQQPSPVLDYVLPFISNILFCWTLCYNTSFLFIS